MKTLDSWLKCLFTPMHIGLLFMNNTKKKVSTFLGIHLSKHFKPGSGYACLVCVAQSGT